MYKQQHKPKKTKQQQQTMGMTNQHAEYYPELIHDDIDSSSFYLLDRVHVCLY